MCRIRLKRIFLLQVKLIWKKRKKHLYYVSTYSSIFNEDYVHCLALPEGQQAGSDNTRGFRKDEVLQFLRVSEYIFKIQLMN